MKIVYVLKHDVNGKNELKTSKDVKISYSWSLSESILYMLRHSKTNKIKNSSKQYSDNEEWIRYF